MKKPVWWYIATWFGAGTSPIVSGTVGSLAALPFAYAIQITWGSWALFFAAIAMFIIGCWASEQFVKHSGKEDPGEIVVDEVAGQWLLLSVLFPTWQSYLVGFILFRIFDIVKPWPVCVADRKVKGGFGVMLDDMLAAFYPILLYIVLIMESLLFNSQHLLQPVMTFLVGSYVP
jgi:phosphatidylglycerophosphatase A